jgi:tetratricopeptide (TPR) repeat protein
MATILEHPSQSKALARRARQCLRQGDGKAALKAYDELVLADPEEPRWRRRRVEAVFAVVSELADAPLRLQEAIRRLEVAASDEGGDSIANFELGYGLLFLSCSETLPADRSHRAWQAFEKARLLCPGNLGGWWGQIVMLELRLAPEGKSRDEALLLAHAVTTEIPSDARSWLLLSKAILARNLKTSFDAGIRALDRALAIDPELTEALIIRGRLLETRGADMAAREIYEKIVRIDPDSDIADEARRLLLSLNDRTHRNPDRESSGLTDTRFTPTEPDPPDPVTGAQMPIPQLIPAFKAWPLFTDASRCRILFFESME